MIASRPIHHGSIISDAALETLVSRQMLFQPLDKFRFHRFFAKAGRYGGAGRGY